MKPSPSFRQISEAFSYDPETGILIWKYRADIAEQANTAHTGTIAGSKHVEGYLHVFITIDGIGYRLRNHRIAWILMTGDWPKYQVDHRDGDKGNNRWLNLRDSTHGQNQSNKKTYAKSGFKGVTKTRENSWRAQININGKSKGLGTFRTGEEAHAAFCAAAEKQHGEFAHHLSS